jgi:hypothetical protein
MIGKNYMSILLKSQILTVIWVQLTLELFNVNTIESLFTVAVSKYEMFLLS